MTVIQVPWARHDAGHTRAFDDTVAWLAVHCSRLLQRVAYGFKSPDALIALAMLSVGGHRPDLPGRRMA